MLFVVSMTTNTTMASFCIYNDTFCQSTRRVFLAVSLIWLFVSNVGMDWPSICDGIDDGERYGLLACSQSSAVLAWHRYSFFFARGADVKQADFLAAFFKDPFAEAYPSSHPAINTTSNSAPFGHASHR